MDKETPPRPALGILLEAFEKVDKLIGLFTAIVAYLTFVRDYHVLSYLFVIISYLVFAFSLAKIISDKISLSLIILPSENLGQKYAYSKSQRIWARVALGLLTITTVVWLGTNLYNDIASSMGAPESVVTVYGATPSTDDKLGGDKSLPRFSRVEIDFHGCCYGRSKSNENLVYAIIGRKQAITLGGQSLDMNPNPNIELSTLLLVPNDIVWTKTFLVIDSILAPDNLDNISIMGPVAGRGGSSVPGLGFASISLSSYPITLPLVPQTIAFPFRLNHGDVYDIGIPLSATQSGEYYMHLEAEFTLFSGETLTAISPQIYFGILKIDQ